MKTVYCIGELLIDFIATEHSNDLSKTSQFTKKPGGAPANVACAISKLGGLSNFIGAVGNDPFGNFLIEVLEQEQVDTSLIQKSVAFTTLAFVSLSKDGERDFVFSRGADKELKYNPTLKSRFKGNMLHFGAATAFLGGELESAYGRYFFDALTHESFISFDPNYRENLWLEGPKKFIKKCLPLIEKSHLCKFSKEEAILISGKENLEEICNYFHSLGCGIITITLGKEGTILSTANHKSYIKSITVNAIDTTGAGDAFIGCLLHQISTIKDPFSLENDPKRLVEMILLANKAAAISTTNYGAIPSLVTTAQLLRD